MSPIELIAKGLKNQDWQDVANGYAALTGVHISVPKSTANDPVSLLKRALAQLSNTEEVSDEPAAEYVEEAQEDVKPNKPVRKPRKAKTPKDNQPSSKMVFIGGEDVPMSDEERLWNKKIANSKKNREVRAPKKSTFTCDGCSKTLPLAAISVTRIGEGNNRGEQLCVKCKSLRRR